MKILFVNLSNLKFNVATPRDEPLGGSESCVCYLAEHLAKRGYDVSLVARLPKECPPVVSGVKHHFLEILKDEGFFPKEIFDVIIVCNAPIICPYLKATNPQAKIILWDHVPPDQPSMAQLGQPEIQEGIDLTVYVSKWQKTETEKRFAISSNAAIIGNGLTPSFENMFRSREELLSAKQNRAAYTTIPYRGLPLLLKVFDRLQQKTELDIFSSMRVYQQDDKEYEALYRNATRDQRIHYHGSVSQAELAQRLKPVAFLTYPCICEETFCIGALEAMAAGMKVIATRLGALSTTTMGFAELIPVDSHNAEDLIPLYRSVLDKNITLFLNAKETWADRLFEQVKTVNKVSNWNAVTEEWEKLFKN